MDTNDAVRPNKPLELTPLRVDKIRPILKARFGPTVFPIYRAAQLSGRAFGGFYFYLCYTLSGTYVVEIKRASS